MLISDAMGVLLIDKSLESNLIPSHLSPNFLNEPRVYTEHLSLFLYPSFFWRDREKEKDAQYIPEVH